MLDYGATITRLLVPDRVGRFADVVLGYDDLASYQAGPYFLGATIGRVGNRIEGGRFELAGKSYQLALTDPPHHLHGGKRGWDKRFWSSSASATAEEASVRLVYESPAGEEGYPGRVLAETIYTLTEQGLLRIEMTATAEEETLVNMVHHSYFNLRGHDAGTIADHELTLHCDEYTPGLVPDGTVEPVDGTCFDFRRSTRIGDALPRAGGTPLGFDQNLLVRGEPTQLRPVARLCDPHSGRVMDVSANQPGLQFYTGNFLDGTTGGKGTRHGQHSALCLEPQAVPNAVHVPEWRSQVVLSPHQRYQHIVMLQFRAQ